MEPMLDINLARTHQSAVDVDDYAAWLNVLIQGRGDERWRTSKVPGKRCSTPCCQIKGNGRYHFDRQAS
jgi:hypothetical protein